MDQKPVVVVDGGRAKKDTNQWPDFILIPSAYIFDNRSDCPVDEFDIVFSGHEHEDIAFTLCAVYHKDSSNRGTDVVRF